MGGDNISLQFETGVISSGGGPGAVRLANTGDFNEHATIELMPGFLTGIEINLPPQSTQEFLFNFPEGFKGAPTLSWVRIQVSSDQVVPTANLDGIQYLPGDFAAFNLFTGTGSKARLW